MSTKNFVFAFVAAAAAGATIALILAPEDGKMTRKKLSKRVTSVKDTLAYLLLQAEDIVEHLHDKTGNKVTLSHTAAEVDPKG